MCKQFDSSAGSSNSCESDGCDSDSCDSDSCDSFAMSATTAKAASATAVTTATAAAASAAASAVATEAFTPRKALVLARRCFLSTKSLIKLNDRLCEMMLCRVTMHLSTVKRRDYDVFCSAVLSSLKTRPVDLTKPPPPQPGVPSDSVFVLNVPQLTLPMVPCCIRNSQKEIFDGIISDFLLDPDKDWDDDIIDAEPGAFFCLTCSTLVPKDLIHEHSPFHALEFISNLFRPTLSFPSFHSRFCRSALSFISKILLSLRPKQTKNIVCLGCPSVHEELCDRGLFDSVRTRFTLVASLVMFAAGFA